MTLQCRGLIRTARGPVVRHKSAAMSRRADVPLMLMQHEAFGGGEPRVAGGWQVLRGEAEAPPPSESVQVGVHVSVV